MKESEAKLKKCPHNQIQAALRMVTIMLAETTVEGRNAGMDEMNRHNAWNCYGSDCAMWECEYKIEDKQVTETQDLEDCKPEGEGWYHQNTLSQGNRPALINWRRHVPTENGDCGLKSKETYCNYPG